MKSNIKTRQCSRIQITIRTRAPSPPHPSSSPCRRPLIPSTHHKSTTSRHHLTITHSSSPTTNNINNNDDQPHVTTLSQDYNVDGDYCIPSYVTIDNHKDQDATILEVEVMAYPGLIRVLAWTLNGLDVVANNAVIHTKPNGMAHNTFWLTDRSGNKIDDATADAIGERVRDFVIYCSPKAELSSATEFSSGPITVSNSEHPEYTVVCVQEQQRKPGFLLEVASVLSGLNAEVMQGIIHADDTPNRSSNSNPNSRDKKSGTNQGKSISSLDSMNQGRLFKFWVRDRRGEKLDYNHVSALVYALGLALGFRSYPTIPPDQEVLLSAR